VYHTQRFAAANGQKLTGRKAECPILRSLYGIYDEWRTNYQTETEQLIPGSTVFGRSMTGITGSNPADDMKVLLLCLLCCVGSGLCDGLINRTGES
jgi:hypothetical protein